MNAPEHFSDLIYPSNFENKIGFDTIKELISNECLSGLGTEYVDKIRFSSQRAVIERNVLQTIEFKNICLLHRDFPVDNYHDLRPALRKLEVAGVYINVEALSQLLLSLQTISDILFFFKKADAESFPYLKKAADRYYIDKHIINRAAEIIDEKGSVKDSASELLSEIRKTYKRLLKSREKKIEGIYHSWLTKGTATDTGITLRNGRLVIPVHAAQKRQVRGFIYDESATGQTIYIEPAELFELNNDIADCENAEKKEIIRILTDFTDYIRPSLHDLLNAYIFLGLIDFIRAKAKFSIKINAVNPFIKNTPFLDLKEARHPLLLLKNKTTPHKVVPLSLTLNDSQSVLIISGPNSGGKSVCLKTVGLLQYMFQCGLPVPVEENSSIGIFKRIFIEIGDEQSLENDLSTYSSHLKNMSFFTQNSNKYTLFLIDEMGSGTEPQIGGAIAESVIERLHELRAFGIITTHYTNLKMLPQKHTGIKNAAMLFDTKHLVPLYILKTGEAGSSFAFEIAQKIGLDKEVIEHAKGKIDANIVGFEEYYLKVKEKEQLLGNKMKDIEKSDEILSSTYQKYQNLLTDIENQKQEIYEKAKQEAQTLLSEANKKIEHVIKTIKESQAEKETTKLMRTELSEYKEEIKPQNINTLSNSAAPLHQSNKQKKKEKITDLTKTIETDTSNKPLEPGNYVIMDGQSEVGIIEDIKDDIVFAVFGNLRIKTLKNKLKRVLNYKPVSPKKSIGLDIINSINEKKKNFNSSLDLRGKRAEEALTLLNNYINDALLCQITPLRILHGKGDGILRPLIRQELAKNEYVKNCYDEKVELGGQGITIVELK